LIATHPVALTPTRLFYALCLFLPKLPTHLLCFSTEKLPDAARNPKSIGLKSLMRWKKWLKKVKDVYSWYSFASGIAGLTGLSLIVSPVVVLVLGVIGSAIKGVPWPITVMAGFCTLVAGAYLVALPIFIRAETRPILESNIADEPIVKQAACLLMNLDPSAANLQSPGVDPWIVALCAAIRTGDLDLFRKFEGLPLGALMEKEIMRQRAQASWQTEIPKAALIDFAKRNDRDLKYLGQ
jgi:hypothetical protein